MFSVVLLTAMATASTPANGLLPRDAQGSNCYGKLGSYGTYDRCGYGGNGRYGTFDRCGYGGYGNLAPYCTCRAKCGHATLGWRATGFGWYGVGIGCGHGCHSNFRDRIGGDQPFFDGSRFGCRCAPTAWAPGSTPTPPQYGN